MKILVTDSGSLKSHNDLSLEVLNQFGEVVEYSGITREQLLKEVVDTDILLCNKTVIDREVMSVGNTLKYVGLFATGFKPDLASGIALSVFTATAYSIKFVLNSFVNSLNCISCLL